MKAATDWFCSPRALPPPRASSIGSWLTALTVAILICVACEPSQGQWSRSGWPVDKRIIQTFMGPAHCGLQDSTFLVVAWPLGSAAAGSLEPRWYVRNPSSSLQHELLGVYATDVRPPRDAAFTGYSAKGLELWLAPSDQDSEAYLKVDRGFEKWPRTRHPLMCA